jgi:hypothetical protein
MSIVKKELLSTAMCGNFLPGSFWRRIKRQIAQKSARKKAYCPEVVQSGEEC